MTCNIIISQFASEKFLAGAAGGIFSVSKDTVTVIPMWSERGMSGFTDLIIGESHNTRSRMFLPLVGKSTNWLSALLEMKSRKGVTEEVGEEYVYQSMLG